MEKADVDGLHEEGCTHCWRQTRSVEQAGRVFLRGEDAASGAGKGCEGTVYVDEVGGAERMVVWVG